MTAWPIWPRPRPTACPRSPTICRPSWRARIVEKAAPTLVTMGAHVSFRDEDSGEVRDVTLVYPKDQDLAQGRLSVLTPVGRALLGLTAGQSIPWRTRDGRWKTLTVVNAAHPAAASTGAEA